VSYDDERVHSFCKVTYLQVAYEVLTKTNKQLRERLKSESRSGVDILGGYLVGDQVAEQIRGPGFILSWGPILEQVRAQIKESG
jgi:hypothetical protein